MKPNIQFSKDENTMTVKMTFLFASSKGPELRRRLAEIGYELHPYDWTTHSVGQCVSLISECKTSVRDKLEIYRIYKVYFDYDKYSGLAKDHAEKYYQSVISDLKNIA